MDEPDATYPATPTYEPEPGQETRRISYDDRDRYDPGTGYPTSAYGDENPAYPDEPYTEDRRYDRHRRYDDDFTAPDFFPEGNGGRESAFPTSDGPGHPAPHPFAATPPPPVPSQAPRRAHSEQHRAAEDPSAAQRASESRAAEQQQVPPQRGMPTPLPKPIPLKVDSEETELAAKRLAALLRDNPSLLHQSPND